MNHAPTTAAFRATIQRGGTTAVDLALDTEPRVVEVPTDLAAALSRDAEAGRVFEGLAYSHKQRHVLAIEGAKTDETRHRRIVKAVERLRAGRT